MKRVPLKKKKNWADKLKVRESTLRGKKSRKDEGHYTERKNGI